MSNPTDPQTIKDKYNLALNYYDKQLYDFNFVSTLKLFLYAPFGILLLLLRLASFIILNIMIIFKPNLEYNGTFIQLVCLALGVFAKSDSVRTKNNRFKIYASNHITSFDYLAIKSLVNESNHIDENMYPSSRLGDVITLILTKILQNNSKKTKKSTIFFPEIITTNGSYGILKFDSYPFDLLNDNADSFYSCVPVCIKINRPFLPFNVNHVRSSDLTNILLTLFTPITIYSVKFLPEEVKLENESSERFAERIRTLIGSYLKLDLSDMERYSLKQVFANYQQYLVQQHQLQLQQIRRLNLNNRQSENSVSFTDISRVALQIKDILPDVSFETIKHHITISASLDIDTVLASILDSNDSSSNTDSSAPSTSMIASNEPKKASKGSIVSYMSYEERKFKLLNEARQRYLSKNKI